LSEVTMSCVVCGKNPPFRGYCEECQHKLLLGIRTRAGGFADIVIDWVKAAERKHLDTLFYSDEAEQSGNVEAKESAQTGCAKGGFVCKSKVFTKVPQASSADAVRAFLTGGITVCECEGLLHAVMFNALVDVCGKREFDLMFPQIVIGSPTTGVMSVIDEINVVDEKTICAGDWAYVLTTARVLFTEAVGQSGKGAAGGGWNLICTNPGRYVGFGINKKGEAKDFVLDEIRELIAAEATGKAAEPGFDRKTVEQRFKQPLLGNAPVKSPSTPSASGHRRTGSGGTDFRQPGDMDKYKKPLPDVGSGKVFSEGKAAKSAIKDSVKLQWVRRFNPDKLLALSHRALLKATLLREKGG
jgi:hypothetical protein